MSEDFMAGFKGEGRSLDDLFDETGEDNPADSPSDEQPDDTTHSQDGDDQDKDKEEELNSPAEKPVSPETENRFQKLVGNLKDKDDKIAELESKIGDVSQQINTRQDDTLPSYWVELYGDDDTSRKAYRIKTEQDAQTRDQIKQEVMEEQKAVQDKARQEEERWKEFINAQIDDLRSEGKDFDINELRKVAVEMQPTDADGNISMRKAYDILELQKAAKKNSKPMDEKKKVASMTASDNKGSVDKVTVPSTNSLRNASFQSLAQED